MSQMPPECRICRDADATDAFGWCDACADLYDQPEDEAPIGLSSLQAEFTNDVLREIMSAQILTLRHFPH